MGPRVVVLATLVLAAMVAGVPVGMGVGARCVLDWFGTWGSALLALLASRPDRRAAAV